MLTAKDFIARWGQDADPLARFPKKSVERLTLADEDKAFLVQAGLPEEAAPFLAFEAPPSGELPTVAEQWDQPKEFQKYRVIGADGAGSPIALDESRHGEVVCLDHDNRFARVLMNQSVRQLAESLLAYRKLIHDTQAEGGEEAFLNGQISAAAREAIQRELTRIDSAAMKPGCFWPSELANLDANAG